MIESNRTPFEIARGARDQSQKLKLPTWLNKQSAPQSPKPGRGAGLIAWWTRPVALPMSRAVVAGAIVLVIAMVVVAHQIGSSTSQIPPKVTDARSTRQLAQIQSQAVNTQLLAANIGSTATGAQSTATSSSAPAQLAIARSGASGTDPRQAGLNYYCLATMPQRYRTQGEQIVAYLRKNQVDAMVVDAHNQKIQVVALQGFETLSSPEARRFRERLRALGIAWKAEHGGFTDWHDMYAIKHRSANTTDSGQKR